MIKTFKQWLAEEHEWPNGHWYNHDSGKLHDISEDGGPGDHMGFLLMTYKPGLAHELQVPEHHVEALRKMYDEMTPSDESHEATEHVYAHNTRLIHRPKEIGVETGEKGPTGFKKAQQAVTALMKDQPHRFNKDTKVTWSAFENYNESEHHPIPVSEFMTSKHRDMEKHRI